MTAVKVALSAAGAIVLVFIFTFALTGMDLASFRFWAPQYRDAQREVFQNSQAYVQGKVSHLTRLRLSYESTEGPQREALRRQIIVEASEVDSRHLPPELVNFIQAIQ